MSPEFQDLFSLLESSANGLLESWREHGVTGQRGVAVSSKGVGLDWILGKNSSL